MPMFHAMPHDVAGAACHFADGAGIDKVSGKLVGAAQKRIRGGSYAQTLCFCQFRQFKSFGSRQHKRFFGIDILAAVQNLLRNTKMSSRDCEIDNDVNVVSAQKVFNCISTQTKFLRSCCGGIRIDVSTGSHFKAAKERRKSHIGC